MLRRLRSLQEQCRSKSSLLERPFCNIGQTQQKPQSPLANVSETLQQNVTEVASNASSPKQNISNQLPSNCVDAIVESEDLLSLTETEKSGKRTHSEVDGDNMISDVDHITSLSPARKRPRQDTLESVGSENAVNVEGTDALPSEKSLTALITSPAERSFDSSNVELNLSAGFSRSGSCTLLSGVNKLTSIVRSANSSPRTWPSRRDIGQSVIVFYVLLLCCMYCHNMKGS